MRVILVKELDTWLPHLKDAKRPTVGHIDKVIDTETFLGHDYYALEKFGMDDLFRADYFAILPDDTADEVEAGEKEAIVNLEIV